MYSRKNASFRRPLSNDALMALAPSLFTTTGHPEKTSERYSVIPSIQVIDGLRSEGFLPVWAGQSGRGANAMGEHQKHLVVLTHRDSRPSGEDALTPEILLTNSHNGTSAYKLTSGLFRMVCSNGLVAGDAFAEQRVRHSGDVVGRVIEGAFEIVRDAPRLLERAYAMRSVRLEYADRKAFATLAAYTRWDREVADPETGLMIPNPAIPAAETLMAPRRYDDRRSDLWTTFNTIQEHIIRGGDRVFIRENGRVRRTTTREITRIDTRNAVNGALWTLAESMADLKGVKLAA